MFPRRLIERTTDGKSPARSAGCVRRSGVASLWTGLRQLRVSEMLRLPRIVLLAALVTAPSLSPFIAAAQSGASPHVDAVRFWSFGDVTRIAVQTQGSYRFTFDQVERPARVYFDLNGLRPPSSVHRGVQVIPVGDRRVKQIRVAEVKPGRTRLVFDLEGPAEVISSQLVNPDRLIIEIRPKGTSLPALLASHRSPGSIPVLRDVADSPAPETSAERPAPPPLEGFVPPPASPERPLTTARAVTIQRTDGLVVQQVSPSPSVRQVIAAPASSFTPAPSRTVVPVPSPVRVPPPSDSLSSGTSSKVIGVAAPAKKDSAGDRSLVRVFGLKMGKVVIDAGHGGHDTGTIGAKGLMEKDLVLDVALRLGALITQQLGAQVVYTRSDDTFIPLEQRTKIANMEKADLFISIHANSSPEPSASGVETYFFNLTSDRNGLDVATRENATSVSAISDLNDMLHRAVLQAKLEESREFAQTVQTSLWAGSVKMDNHSRDRGVRQAPFVVLIGATMPSILAEIGFVSNPHDEKLLRRGEERERIAEALFKGVSQYAAALSHVDIASSGSH